MFEKPPKPKGTPENLDLKEVTSAEGLNLPKTIGKDADIENPTPPTEGDLDLKEVTSAEGLNSSKTIGKDADIENPTPPKD